MVDVIKKKSVAQLAEMFANAGKESFDINVSNQAANILKHLEWSQSEWDEFIAWYVKERIVIGGVAVLEYLRIKKL